MTSQKPIVWIQLTQQKLFADLAACLSKFMLGLWNRWLAECARHTTRRILARLDDRTLKDIGLHRSEISSVVNTRRINRI